MSTTESELEVTDDDIDAISDIIGYHPSAWDCANERALIRAIVEHFRAKPAASAEPVAWQLKYPPKIPLINLLSYPDFVGSERRALEMADALKEFGKVEIKPLYSHPPAPQWLPIESAPKDGLLFLCWVRAVRYGEDDGGANFETDVSDIDFGRWNEMPTGGFYENMAGQIGDAQDITHWMPLPAAPGKEG